jgi:hypothetical protein
MIDQGLLAAPLRRPARPGIAPRRDGGVVSVAPDDTLLTAYHHASPTFRSCRCWPAAGWSA